MPDLHALHFTGANVDKIKNECISNQGMTFETIEMFDKFTASYLDDATFQHFAFIVKDAQGN